MSKPAKADSPAEGEMTIGELAERTGMTVRNIRAHQTRGILPPPVVHGRTGYYNEEHVARIELTRELQAEGLNLEAIRRMGESVNGAAEEIHNLTRSLRVPFEEEAPEIVDLVELAEIWKQEVEEGRGFEMLERGEKLGTIRTLPDGKVEVISPQMMKAAAALAEVGMSSDAVLAVAEKLRRKADEIADLFTDLFLEQVWKPFDEAGRPESEWPRVRETLERTRPLGADVLLGVFQIAIAEATDKALGQTIRKVARRETEKAKGKGRGRKQKKSRR
ncbi:MAG TPA: MerR family transcriptional regulator [Solirubrobacterales bacterium]|nr:MerR family transcriptional regulator [Solirubrobacterales bacterium]